MKTRNLEINRIFAVCAAALSGLATASATIVDLRNTDGATGTIGGVKFTAGQFDFATGSGAWDPFLRIQDNDGEEEGFNTGNVDRMPDVKDGNPFNKEVQLSALRVVNVGGTDFVRLALDLGEPSADAKSTVSLVDLQFYVRDTTVSNATNTTELFSGTPLFQFGAGDRVDLDYDLYKNGNGKSDMFLYIPVTFFAGYEANDYFYLYSKFGTTGTPNPPYPAEGTYEEWGNLPGEPINFDNPPPIPEPTTMLFGGALLGVMGFARRRSR